MFSCLRNTCQLPGFNLTQISRRLQDNILKPVIKSGCFLQESNNTVMYPARLLSYSVQKKDSPNFSKNVYSSVLKEKQIYNVTKIQKQHFFEDRKTKSVTIWEGIKEVRHSPMPALILGFSGLIPFVAAPGYMILSQFYMPSMAFAQTVYGACILSFLGGVRWGITVPEESYIRPDWFNLGYSVTPSLVAWIALLLPSSLSMLTVLSGLAATAYLDTTMFGYPPWFKGLRFLLSLIAVLSLWTTLMCGLMLNSSQDNNSKPAEAVTDEK